MAPSPSGAHIPPPVDSDGVLRKHVEYDSFGKITAEQFFAENGSSIAANHAEAVDQLFYWQGQSRDEVTGLQQHDARWYAPELGRWMSEDPLVFDVVARIDSQQPRAVASAS